MTTYDAKDPDTRFLPIRDVRPPKGAPNVLVILIDDVGYGAASVFGGPCHTPNFEKLAAGGLKYTRFHTTALCSPTRQALLTGRNHHSVGMGGITEIATGAPGYSSVLPNNKAPLAMTLKLNGYSTAQFGKCHEVPVWQTSPAGPFNAWPTGGGGFEYFYGFIGGENNQWDPALYEGTTAIEPPKTPAEGYHLTEDLTDKAINWARQQKALMADKPFFMYFAPGATHAPHHVPKEWIDKYKGKFAHGWDKQREITFRKQKELGVIAANAVLTPRHKEIPAWEEMDPKLKPALEREMEVYAAFMEHTDYHVGRLIDALGPVIDDTLIYLIVGDNGASAEGTIQGAFNEMANFNGMAALETPEFMMSKLDEFGGEHSYGHYAVGWAWAMNSPYQWTKQVASHWGGTRNGIVVHWPNGIKEKGGTRNQFSHVIDLAPTVLEAAGIPQPTVVNGVMQSPYEGTSMLYSFNDAQAAERHETQYFEMFCNRGIYHKGWSAVTKHRTPWVMLGQKTAAFDDDVWELYDGSKDWTQAKDLSKDNADKLHELQRLWLIEAVKYNVLPLDDRGVERFDAALSGRPTLVRGNSQMLFSGMGRLSENSVVNIKNKSFSVTADLEVAAGGAEGVIIAQGGRFGGWSLYARGGKAKFVYNVLGIKAFDIEATKPIPAGKTQVRMEFAYDGGGMAKGGTVTLYCDGKEVGNGRVEQTQPLIFSADETTDIGYESGTSVSPDYTAHGSRFNGKINWVQIDLGKDAADADHFIDHEERVRVVMARQ
ncbi:sulfatase-like hydrolase/transferase [Variovorax sp. DT-64]|uniref:sulfatase-like hydrolase/transferase n=1 Tax=Variovorax sp. DT-64 TaxID=3396160 RepID=UPI003F1AF750